MMSTDTASNLDGHGDHSEVEAEARAHFRRTLVRVMAMQVVALAALWLLQMRYAS